MRTDAILDGLPGAERIRQGLADIAARRQTIASCLVDICGPRLRRAGLLPPEAQPVTADPEIVLYGLLQSEPGDAYSRYNALLREMDSFAAALDHRVRRRGHWPTP